MALSFDEACAAVTAPDQPFALVDAEIRGQTYKVFANAPATLAAMFEQAAARGDQDFLVYEDERWSFADVVAHGRSLANRLIADFGIQKGDRVAIAMRNYPEWITSFVGIVCAGGVAVPLNAWWGTDELAYGLTDSGAEVIIADQERLERIAVRLNDLGVRAIVVRCATGPAGATPYDSLIDLHAPAPDVDIEPDDDATILYTSGTTGNAKGAVATHRCHTNALMGYWCRATVDSMRAAAAKADAGIERSDDNDSTLPSFILTVPLFHVTGCVPVMLGAFGIGTKLVMMFKWEPRRALELVEREQVTNFVGVPTMVQDVLECADFDKYDTSSLKSIGGGGAPAAPDLVRRVDRTFRRGRPGIGYGMTETTAYGPQNGGDDYLAKPSSAGRAVPVMQMKVIDEHGNDLPVNTQGEICFYGPTVIREYWNKPDETAAVFLDGWLRSGDLGRIDEDGFVFVEDRAKDVVIRAGENIGCIEVEAAIAEHPSVYEVAVFGLPHQRLGEELACAIYLREGATLSVEEIQDHVGERLAAFKVPSVVIITEEMLPRSAQGKILKRHIRDELARQRTAAG
ncbi:MAG: acyl--CoA ligase [Acidimicrobiia bacterium]|nr:acyl--CoA ligase [Acidimicrobiia bacterium]MDH5237255.1 acyl--CoA ligase [Acidimicrobiia bacterium]